MNIGCSPQLTFVLGGFLGQNVALKCLTTLDCTAWAHAKTLLRAAFGFHFWHNNFLPSRAVLLFYDYRWQQTLTALGCPHSLLISNGIEAIASRGVPLVRPTF